MVNKYKKQILAVLQRSKERKERLLNGEREVTIDRIDSDALAEITNILKQQSQECVQETNKKKRIKPVAPGAEEKQE